MFRSVCEICEAGILWHGAALGICAKRGITESGISRGKSIKSAVSAWRSRKLRKSFPTHTRSKSLTVRTQRLKNHGFPGLCSLISPHNYRTLTSKTRFDINYPNSVSFKLLAISRTICYTKSRETTAQGRLASHFN